MRQERWTHLGMWTSVLQVRLAWLVCISQVQTSKLDVVWGSCNDIGECPVALRLVRQVHHREAQDRNEVDCRMVKFKRSIKEVLSVSESTEFSLAYSQYDLTADSKDIHRLFTWRPLRHCERKKKSFSGKPEIESSCAFPPWFCRIHKGIFWLRNCSYELGNIDLGKFDSCFGRWTIDLFFV